ncbi:MAG: hypothetical protein ACRCTR_09060 [Actinomycetota bacterium]
MFTKMRGHHRDEIADAPSDVIDIDAAVRPRRRARKVLTVLGLMTAIGAVITTFLKRRRETEDPWAVPIAGSSNEVDLTGTGERAWHGSTVSEATAGVSSDESKKSAPTIE